MTVDSAIIHEIKKVLKGFGDTYLTNTGALKRSKIIEDLDKYTPILMKELLASPLIAKTYTEAIGDITIFKLNQFIEMFTYKEYWEDSYTKYSNKIGLTAGGKFIDETADVVLDFPFKDTVLKAGMTKEDDKDANEPFLNEVIAKSEIDTLFEPKIFVNTRKYDTENPDGKPVSSFSGDDNLIIKGNNLIALHSIKERYAGKVKLIYIDPPFNTGTDSFEYNDRFSRSSWLTFMFNRLEVARDLLTEDGNIFIHIDINQSHYLKVLADNIFGENNFVEEIIWGYGSASGGRAAGTKPVNVHDYILHYAKNYPLHKANKVYTPYSEKYIKDWFKFDDGDGRIYRKRQRGHDENGEGIWEKQYLEDSKGVPLTTVWTDIKQIYANPQAYKETNQSTSEIEKDFGNSGQKPEALLKRIIEMSTDEGDIVLDFFMGTATTACTAMKLKRRFITIEQMDSQIEIGRKRLVNVIRGKKSGISKEIDWLGGGSFVYAELFEKNQGYLKDVLSVTDNQSFEKIYDRMVEGTADLDFRVDLDTFKTDTQDMNFTDRKKLLLQIIDKNQLYYQYSEIDDIDVHDLVNDGDYEFNKEFYGEEG